jgi:hypothetical protein
METFISLSESGIGQIKALARNILLTSNFSTYNEPYIFPERTLKSAKNKRIPVKMDIYDDDLIIYPNPATNLIQIELSNPDYHSNGILSIIDITGKLIIIKKIDNWQKLYILNTQEFKQGVYLVSYSDQNGRNMSKVIIISD